MAETTSEMTEETNEPSVDAIERTESQSESIDILEGNEEDEGESLESLKKRLAEMEEESRKIEKLQQMSEQNEGKVGGTSSDGNVASGPEADVRSVYVGNVDYSTKPEELCKLFASCGEVERVTILCDKWTGQPKGFAYIQFNNNDDVENAQLLDGTEFKQRILKVAPKRTNIPGFNRGGRGGWRGRGRGRGRGRRGRGRGRYGGSYRGRFHNRKAVFY